jgi:hypothetical protein
MLITASIGAFYKNIQLPNLQAPDGTPLEISTSLVIAACLIPPAFVGSYIGASMMHRLPMTVIKRAFALLLVIAAWRMGYTAVNGVQGTQDDGANVTSELASPSVPGELGRLEAQVEPRRNREA